MIAQVKCSILARGLKRNCEKLCKELDADKESIEKEANHYRMICTTYFPSDVLLEFYFADLAYELSVDISYLFSEYDDQLCTYDEDYNLDNFLALNHLSASGTEFGFGKETGATDDLKLLIEFLNSPPQKNDSQNWFRAFETVMEYGEQLTKQGKFNDQISVSANNASMAVLQRVRLAAEAGDEYAKTILETYEKLPIP